VLRRVAARRQENGLVQGLIKGSVNCRLWVVVVVGHERSGPRSPGGVDENATPDLDKPGSHWTFVLDQSRRWMAPGAHECLVDNVLSPALIGGEALGVGE